MSIVSNISITFFLIATLLQHPGSNLSSLSKASSKENPGGFSFFALQQILSLQSSAWALPYIALGLWQDDTKRHGQDICPCHLSATVDMSIHQKRGEVQPHISHLMFSKKENVPTIWVHDR